MMIKTNTDYLLLSNYYMCTQSKEVGTAAYDSAWYELKPENSRILILVILRAQKQLTLTAGKMMDLSLESFTSVRFSTQSNSE